ncbi:MAG: hypothetical protein KA140_07655 [Caldisericia bacterium]|nr:hypothetical protein [Caldisericia bacterium]
MPTEPDWWFVEKDSKTISLYNQHCSISDIFKLVGSCTQTERDFVTVRFNASEVKQVVNDFYILDECSIISKYECYDSRDWKVSKAKKDIVTNYDLGKIHTFNYRPFDCRYTFYTGNTRGFIGTPQLSIAQNYLLGSNIGLSFSRQLISAHYAHVLITNTITERCYISIKSRECAYNAPLYLYENQLQQVGSTVAEYVKVPNFKQDFLTFIKEKYNHELTPEQILGYIYAVLHCPTYRKKYFEFLKVDFPRIPFLDRQYFDQLSKLGQLLIDHHLLKIHYPQKELSHLEPAGSNKIEKSEWVDGKMKINSNQYFTNISKEVWEFEIGGYKVLQHYLKDRKGRTIDYDEELHIGKTAKSLEETIRLMKEIDFIAGEQI